MKVCRPVTGFLVAALILTSAGGSGAESPEAGGRERHWYLVRASKEFDAGRFEKALVSFEAAARLSEEPLPAEAVRRWGIAASETGWPLAAYVRLSQYLASMPGAAGRGELQSRIDRARRTLLEIATRQSRVIVQIEPRPSGDVPGERQVIRLMAKDGRATVEALSGARVTAPSWERAGQIDEGSYVGLVARLLESPALLDDSSPQIPDPNDPAPRRVVVLRLVLGPEERVRQALRGEPYDRLQALAQLVLDFSRTVQTSP